MTYTAASYERLDMLCWRYYGHLMGTVEAVLMHPANAHLRHLDIARIPPGTAIILPPQPAQQLPQPRVF